MNLGISRIARKRRESGHAILVSLVVLSVIAALTGTAIVRTSGTARMAARATDYAEVERVSDGMIEYAYGVWKGRTQEKDNFLHKDDTDNLLGNPPVFAGFTDKDSSGVSTFSILPVNEYGSPFDASGQPVTKPKRVLTYLADYPGWKGFTFNYVASVTMNHTGSLNGPKAGTRRYFQYTQVPLFQAMYFYEHNLEIYRPAPMIVGGLVHSNSKLFLSGSKDQSGVELTFQGNVSHVQGVTTTEPPLGGPDWAGLTMSQAKSNMEAPTYPNGGELKQVSRVDRYEPLGVKAATKLNPSATNPNDDSFREIIEMPDTSKDDPPEISKRRMSNKAGITMNIVSESSGISVTVTTQNGTSLTPEQEISLKAAIVGKTTIYDQREAKDVDVVNIDVSKMTPVLNDARDFNGVLYVYDSTPEKTGDREPRTLRLQKGGVLPDDGLTIASPNPVYIQGDYNTGTTTNPNSVPANNSGNPNNTSSPVVSGYTRKPAAVIADAVMLLSNSWSDSKAKLEVSERAASNTTYNTAIMAGFMPSGWDPPAGSDYGYSGGANNYPRFLENWTDKSCTYFGSMVELFESKVFTGEWDTGVIYRPPKRRWNFDPNFADNPPPGSVDAVVMTRGTWARL
jgi:hypothetical protein